MKKITIDREDIIKTIIFLGCNNNSEKRALILDFIRDASLEKLEKLKDTNK